MEQTEFDIDFVDVSAETGVNKKTGEHGTFGVMWADLNNDGWLDLIFANHVDLPSLHINQSADHFIDHSQESGLRTEYTYPGQEDRHGIASGDYDNDGNTDLFIAHGGNRGETLGVKYDELLRNQGNLTFVEVSHQARVLNCWGRARTPTWVDFDNDGWLDLYIGNRKTPNVLYKNNNGTFTDVTERAGLETHEGQQQAWADYNQDGWTDVLIIAPVQLYRNNGDETFTEVTRQAGLSPYYPGGPRAVAWGDYNNDGYVDLFITSTRRMGQNTLYKNNGDGTFEQVLGLFGPGIDEDGMGVAWADMDNDGDLDLLVVGTKRMRFFENIGGRLVKRSLNGLSMKPGYRGDVAFGDYDNDGFLDLAISTSERQFLFKNMGNDNNWLTITFEGTASNRQGLGAKVWIRTDTDKLIFREYQGGTGTLFCTGCPPLHVGLGKAHSASLRIRWPSGVEQTLEDVIPNQIVEIKEP
ncbi:CRTAC1 family protein [Chloroflexota bacterium]